MDEKVSKESVDYGPGHATRKCSQCIMFLARTHACTLVRGWIDEDAWCERFERKK
jgi:hypothetical protein